MRIVVDRPPLFDRIVRVFPYAENHGVIFTWGEIVYNPAGWRISKEVLAHEAIHAVRQGATEETIRTWWERYLIDPGFRFDEELPAHRAEYLAYCKRHGTGRQKYLAHVAHRLAGPLYNNMITPAQAEHRILVG